MKVNKTTPSQQPLAATAAKILSTSSKDGKWRGSGAGPTRRCVRGLGYPAAGRFETCWPAWVVWRRTISFVTIVKLLISWYSLPPFRNIRCFSFVKWVYLDIFYCREKIQWCAAHHPFLCGGNFFVFFPYRRDDMHACRNLTAHADIMALIAKSENSKWFISQTVNLISDLFSPPSSSRRGLQN
jgi:hypothetical protein